MFKTESFVFSISINVDCIISFCSLVVLRLSSIIFSNSLAVLRYISIFLKESSLFFILSLAFSIAKFALCEALLAVFNISVA